MMTDQLDIERRPQRPQPRLVELNANAQELELHAEEHQAGVDELLAFHARHHADDRVVKRGVIR